MKKYLQKDKNIKRNEDMHRNILSLLPTGSVFFSKILIG